MISSINQLTSNDRLKAANMAREYLLSSTTVDFREYFNRLTKYTPELQDRYSDAAFYIKPENTNLPLDPRDVKRYGYPRGYKMAQTPKAKLDEIGEFNSNLSMMRSKISPYQPNITKKTKVSEVVEYVRKKMYTQSKDVEKIVSEVHNQISIHIKEYNSVNAKMTFSHGGYNQKELPLYYLDQGLPVNMDSLNIRDIYAFKRDYPYAWLNLSSITTFDIPVPDINKLNSQLNSKSTVKSVLYDKLITSLNHAKPSEEPMVLTSTFDSSMVLDGDIVTVFSFRRLKPIFKESYKKYKDNLVLSFPPGVKFLGNIMKNYMMTYPGAQYKVDIKTEGLAYCHFVGYKQLSSSISTSSPDFSRWLGDTIYTPMEIKPKKVVRDIGYFDMFRYNDGSKVVSHNVAGLVSPGKRIVLSRDSAVSYYCRTVTVQQILDEFISIYTPYKDEKRKEYRKISPNEDIYMVNDNTLLNIDGFDSTFATFINREVDKATPNRRISRIDLEVPELKHNSPVNFGGYEIEIRDVVKCHYLL